MRIGILTFHRAYNCGAMLQAWALKIVLERMGHTVEFPDCNHVGDVARWPSGWLSGCRKGLRFAVDLFRRIRYNIMSIPNEDIARFRYRRFAHKFLNVVPCKVSELHNRYDLLVEGSDQVWTEWIVSQEKDVFLLKGVDCALPVIAYAASSGDTPLSKEWKKELASALARYKALSVREEGTKKQIESLTTKHVEVVADPTLLVTKEDYETIAIEPSVKEKYLYVYAIHATERLLSVARAIARGKGLKLIVTPIGQFSRWRAPKDLTYSVSPERMVGYIKNAEFVITNSFHGTMVSLIFNKRLLSLLEQGDINLSRQAMILRKVGELPRLVQGSLRTRELMDRLDRDLNSSLEDILSAYREDSIRWLHSCGI